MASAPNHEPSLRRLPLALSAQLIFAEAILCLVYGFVFEGRWPTVAEAIGATLQILASVPELRFSVGHHLRTPALPLATYWRAAQYSSIGRTLR